MKFNNSSKVPKFSKINKSNPITNSETPKIYKYDVLFDVNHLENLMKQPVYYQVVPEYINKFFFKYGDDTHRKAADAQKTKLSFFFLIFK